METHTGPTESIQSYEDIGNFQITAVLAEEALATVYAAQHRQLDRHLSLKLLRRELVASPEAVGRFLAEAKVGSRLSSPHVPEIFDVGQLDDGRHYYTLEQIDGRCLSELLSGQIPPVRALHIARGIGSALSAAHDKGIIHRDVRPAQVQLVHKEDTVDFVKLLGFGAAPATESVDFLYRAPEQSCGASEAVNARADQYALGVIVYQLLSAELPFPAENFNKLLLTQMTTTPRPLGELVTGIFEHVETAVHRALHKDPNCRFESVREFLQALDAKPAIDAAPFSEEEWDAPPAPTTRWPVRIGVGLSAVALAVLIGMMSLRNKPSKNPVVVVAPVPAATTPAPTTPVLAATSSIVSEPAHSTVARTPRKPEPHPNTPMGWHSVDFAKQSSASVLRSQNSKISKTETVSHAVGPTVKNKANADVGHLLAYPE